MGDGAGPGAARIGQRAGLRLVPPAPSSFEGLVTALINELAAQPGEREMLLILDDNHLVGTDEVYTPFAGALAAGSAPGAGQRL
jgi:LuxR family transcriptional regulator, maltose regulon positive regulatory protein